MKLTAFRPAALSLVALMASAPAAFALDANDFASKLLASYTASAGSGEAITLASPSVAGSTITFASGTAKSADGSTVAIPGPLTFANVAEAADGSYTADSLTLPDINYASEGDTLTVKGVTFKHVFVPASVTPGAAGAIQLFGEFDLGPTTVSVGGTPVVTLDGITIANTYKPSQGANPLTDVSSTGTTNGLKIDLSQVKDAETQAEAQQLGLTQVTGTIAENGSWSLGDGHLNLAGLSLGFDKIGKLDMSFDVTGYTPAFVETLSQASQAMSAGGQQSQAAIGELMAASQKLFVNSVSVRFEDASITNKLLDQFAKQAGASRADYIKALVAAVPQMDPSGQTPPALVKLLQAGLDAYLNNPQSFEVKLAPQAPLGVMDFMAAVMQPDQMVDKIGLKLVVDGQPVDADAAPAAAAPTAPAPQAAPANGDDNNSGSDDSGKSSDDDSDDSGN